jgi:hypothetical protein
MQYRVRVVQTSLQGSQSRWGGEPYNSMLVYVQGFLPETAIVVAYIWQLVYNVVRD